jgi:itaconyl-CoA hydratase
VEGIGISILASACLPDCDLRHAAVACWCLRKESEVSAHELGRTITPVDNIWFTLLTMNTNPMHFDAEYAKATTFGRPLVNSCLTLSIVTGLSVSDISQNAMANLEWADVKLPRPVFEGDTIHAHSEILEVRESKPRPIAGIVRFRTTGTNQHGEVVIEFVRTILCYRRGHSPLAPVSPA